MERGELGLAPAGVGNPDGRAPEQVLEPDLVTSGPYRFVRNPIYTGVLAAIAGTGLAGTLSWFIALAVIGPFFAYSAIVEERFMEEAFPDRYPAYSSRTRRFIPFVW